MQDTAPTQVEKIKFTPIDMDKWTKIVAGWNKSQESQKAYCERLNLNINTFSYVRSKLLKQEKLNRKFIPITIKEEKICDEGHNRLSLENRAGIIVHIPLSISETKLSSLLKVLRWHHA